MAAKEKWDQITSRGGYRVADIMRAAGEAVLGRVVVLQGEGAGRGCVVQEELVMGRDVAAGLALGDTDISRRHARIRRTGPRQFSVEDLGSSNGTSLNGHALQDGAQPLQFGDHIQLGQHTVLLFAHHDPREERMQQAQKLQSLGQLASGIAHDVNNLVGAALTNLQMLKDMPGHTQVAQDCLADSQHALERVVEMVRRLLDFSRRGKLESRPVALLPLVEDALKVLGHRRPQGVAVEVEIPPTLCVLGDSNGLMQVVTNLCANALDAMPSGGRLLLMAHAVDAPLPNSEEERMLGPAPGRFVRLSVVDTGQGMPPDVVARVFEPFFTTKPVGQGTGLGMAIVHGVVHNHGGQVVVRSVPGQGTTVMVYLPACPENALQEAPARQAQANAESWDTNTTKTVRGRGTGKPVILVADDEPVLLRSTQRLLARMDAYDVITAKDGEEAWQLYQARAESIGVVLLDINMPFRSGLDVCLLIRAQHPDAHVVLTSGAELPDHPIMSASGISFLPKPYSEDQLRAAVLGAMVR